MTRAIPDMFPSGEDFFPQIESLLLYNRLQRPLLFLRSKPAFRASEVNMRVVSIVLGLLVVGLLTVGPVSAYGMDHCSPAATVESLHHCVQHAIKQGHITDSGLATSLLAKLDAAEAAVERGQPTVAGRIVRAFIQQVEAQAGKHIEAEHAEHILEHAHHLLEALQE